VKRLSKLFTFSNVVAVVALFLALGGSVYAASDKISGSQIKPKSLPGNRVKPGSLTATQIKAGTITGTQIKAGSLTGQQVVGSSLTGVSASSLGTVQYVSTVVPLVKEVTSGTSGSAGCPAGQKVIGGGARVSDEANSYVNDSGPSTDRNGWTATGWAGIDGVTMTVTAICTVVASSTG
jgi:hypothetical protein